MKTWTREEDAVMLERYASEGARPLAALFGRPVNAVWCHAKVLGLRASKEVQKVAVSRWQSSYDDILRERYAVDGPRTIAKELGVSKGTVENRAKALGLTKEHWTQEADAVIKAGYSTDGAAAVAKVLGLPLSAVYHRARRLGIKYDWTSRRGQSRWFVETAQVAVSVRGDLKCGIYAIRHTDSGRMYVGSALDVFSRWKSHLRFLRQGKHHSRALQATFDKYGPSTLSFEVLEECEAPVLYEREQHFMDLHLPVFNSAPNAGSPRGIKRTPEQRANTSRAMRAFYADPAKRERVKASKSSAIIEKWNDPEFREKMSVALGQRSWNTEEDNYLANLVGHMRLKELAVVFGRSQSAVQNRAQVLGLSLRAVDKQKSPVAEQVQ
jgi:group I intron endonuclease